MSEGLAELARRHGVATDYWDWQGQHVVVSPDTIRAVLAELSVDASDDAAVERSLRESEIASWRRTLAPSLVIRQGWTSWVPVHVPHGSQVTLTALLEDGTERDVPQVDHWVDPREIDGNLVGEATFQLPGDLPLGWHRLRADVRSQDGASPLPGTECALVIAPHRLELPRVLQERKVWGLQEQVYQARSRSSWGIGDLADLATTCRWGGGLGAQFTLVNPMHAAEPKAPLEASPYRPTSRRFANPVYIAVEVAATEQKVSDECAKVVAEHSAAARALTARDTIDHDAVWGHKDAALRAIFADGRTPRQEVRFQQFVEQEGAPLRDFATWCALSIEQGTPWTQWPRQFANPDTPEVQAFREEHADEITYHQWLQWIVRGQLADSHAAALESGMGLGIVHDLAVGVHPEGADAWALGNAFAHGFSVGAPPDQFNQLGQIWNQPPLRPDRIAELGYSPLREMLRGVLGHAGGLRLDHVIGLFRLWWVPEGQTADKGTYVRYDHEAMLGVVALEAHRAGAVVVGEDLGVVEPMAREALAERGILGTSILWFEWDNGQPRDPHTYRDLCLASVTTHDLPPTLGYLGLEHVEIRERLGLLTRSAEEERGHEQGAIDAFTDAAQQAGAVPGDPSEDLVVVGLHRWLAQSPSRMMGVSLADLAGDRRAINQPGTDREYPNWCLPLAGPDRRPVLLEDLVDSARARAIAQASSRD